MSTATSKPYVVNKLPNKTAEVLIYEPIGNSFWEEGLTAKKFAEDIKALGDVRRIDLRINSPGGSMNEGLAIYNTLANHKAKVVAHIDGIALSMASVIAMSAETINMAANGLVMIHNPQWLAMGDANEMRKTADILDRFKSTAVAAYEKKTGRSREDIATLMDEETWFTAEEAVAAGFADYVTEPLEVAASFDLQDLPLGMVVPETVLARRTQFPPPPSRKELSPMSEPLTPQPATIEQLEALNGADSEFVLGQLKAKATLADATNALNARLVDQLKAAQQKLAEAPKPTTQPAAPATPAPLQSATVTAEGIAAFSRATAPTTPPETSGAPAIDPVDEYKKRFNELRARGMSASDAARQVWRDNPSLSKMALASHEKKTGVSYE